MFTPQLNVQRANFVEEGLQNVGDLQGSFVWVDAGCNDGRLIGRMLHLNSFTLCGPDVVIAIDRDADVLATAVGTSRHRFEPTSSVRYFTEDADEPVGISLRGSGVLWPTCLNFNDSTALQSVLVATVRGDLSSHPQGRRFPQGLVRAVSSHLRGRPPKVLLTSIEVLEHVHPLEVDDFTFNLFLSIPLAVCLELSCTPCATQVTVLLTTPNSNFNEARAALRSRISGSATWDCGAVRGDFRRSYNRLRHPDHYFELSDGSFSSYVEYVESWLGAGCNCRGCTSVGVDGSRWGLELAHLQQIFSLGSEFRVNNEHGSLLSVDGRMVFDHRDAPTAHNRIPSTHAVRVQLNMVRVAQPAERCSRPPFSFKAVFGFDRSEVLPAGLFGDTDFVLKGWQEVGTYAHRDGGLAVTRDVQAFELHDIIWHPSAANNRNQDAIAEGVQLPRWDPAEELWVLIQNAVLGDGVRLVRCLSRHAEESSPLNETDDDASDEEREVAAELVPFTALLECPPLQSFLAHCPHPTVAACVDATLAHYPVDCEVPWCQRGGMPTLTEALTELQLQLRSSPSPQNLLPILSYAAVYGLPDFDRCARLPSGWQGASSDPWPSFIRDLRWKVPH